MAKKSVTASPIQPIKTQRPFMVHYARLTNPSDLADDLRKAFADQDKMHFDVLIDRMLADAGCA